MALINPHKNGMRENTYKGGLHKAKNNRKRDSKAMVRKAMRDY
jgi:hypothetical protein